MNLFRISLAAAFFPACYSAHEDHILPRVRMDARCRSLEHNSRLGIAVFRATAAGDNGERLPGWTSERLRNSWRLRVLSLPAKADAPLHHDPLRSLQLLLFNVFRANIC
jgi:hypothetical protein